MSYLNGLIEEINSKLFTEKCSACNGKWRLNEKEPFIAKYGEDAKLFHDKNKLIIAIGHLSVVGKEMPEEDMFSRLLEHPDLNSEQASDLLKMYITKDSDVKCLKCKGEHSILTKYGS